MSIFGSIGSELKRYGEKIRVLSPCGETTVKGILQPLLYKNKMYLGGKQVPTGLFDRGHYLLICPPEVKLPVLGTVFFESKGSRYILKRSETVNINAKPLYVWAVLCPYKEPLKEDLNETPGNT